MNRIGDTINVDGIEYEIMWAGGEGLIPERESKPSDTWQAGPRAYNRTGKFSRTKLYCSSTNSVDNQVNQVDDGNAQTIDLTNQPERNGETDL